MSDSQTGVVRGQQTRIIDGRTYTTVPLPARTGLDIFSRLVAFAGEGVVTLIFAVPEEKRQKAMGNVGIQATILHNFCKNAQKPLPDGTAPDKPMDIMYEMMVGTTCDKIRIGSTEVEGSVYTHFDEHFKAYYTHLMEVVQFVGEVNFAGP